MSFPDPKPYDNLKAAASVVFFLAFLFFGMRYATVQPQTTQAATSQGAVKDMFTPLYVVISEETTDYYPHVSEYFVNHDINKETYITSLKDLIDFLGEYELVRFEDDEILSTSVKVSGYSKRFSQYSVSFSRDLTNSEKAFIKSELLY